jgi:stress response protein YsnF
VTLREEHVSVERRPVQQGQAQPVTGGNPEDLLQDREIVMRETAEEAVVQKVANVREEVVVTKTAEQRVEQVNETVRRTEVDVENGGAGDRSAFSGFGAGGDNAGNGAPAEGFERDRTR